MIEEGAYHEKNELFQTFIAHQDLERAVQMKAYMRNQFEFLGIPAGPRRKLSAPFFKEARKEKRLIGSF